MKNVAKMGLKMIYSKLWKFFKVLKAIEQIKESSSSEELSISDRNENKFNL
jgi:hypothetical protein